MIHVDWMRKKYKQDLLGESDDLLSDNELESLDVERGECDFLKTNH